MKKSWLAGNRRLQLKWLQDLCVIVLSKKHLSAASTAWLRGRNAFSQEKSYAAAIQAQAVSK